MRNVPPATRERKRPFSRKRCQPSIFNAFPRRRRAEPGKKEKGGARKASPVSFSFSSLPPFIRPYLHFPFSSSSSSRRPSLPPTYMHTGAKMSEALCEGGGGGGKSVFRGETRMSVRVRTLLCKGHFSGNSIRIHEQELFKTIFPSAIEDRE